MFGFQQKIMTQQKQQKRKCDLYSGEQSSQYKLILSGSDVGFSRQKCQSSYYKHSQGIKGNYIQRIKRNYDDNPSTNREPQQRKRNYKKMSWKIQQSKQESVNGNICQ